MTSGQVAALEPAARFGFSQPGRMIAAIDYLGIRSIMAACALQTGMWRNW